ncbi:MAG: hypothetical protein Q9209_000147 [Squamulea sp. 1 TL-2023]
MLNLTQMLWNWYTVDSCFISSTWHVTSKGMFAGSCIGVICLVIALEFLRRVQREYDAFLVKQHRARSVQNHSSVHENDSETGRHADVETNSMAKNFINRIHVRTKSPESGPVNSLKPQCLKPNVLQQAIRAFIHMLQFAVAYFIMLLAMYYNGYIIISILIGSYLGSFIFSWEGILITDASTQRDNSRGLGTKQRRLEKLKLDLGKRDTRTYMKPLRKEFDLLIHST